jgi:WD40 repeat protein
MVNPVKGMLAIENVPGQVSIYDLKTGKKINELLFPSELMLGEFSEDGKKFFVLTRNQTYYIFDTEKLAAGV